MATVDTSSWSADTDNNTSIEGIALDSTASIAQTWQAIRALMAALKGDTTAIEALLVAFSGATASSDGTSGLVPQPRVGEQGKFLRGDATWGVPQLSDAAMTEAEVALIFSGEIVDPGTGDALQPMTNAEVAEIFEE